VPWRLDTVFQSSIPLEFIMNTAGYVLECPSYCAETGDISWSYEPAIYKTYREASKAAEVLHPECEAWSMVRSVPVCEIPPLFLSLFH
jgi:hypothetical protein